MSESVIDEGEPDPKAARHGLPLVFIAVVALLVAGVAVYWLVESRSGGGDGAISAAPPTPGSASTSAVAPVPTTEPEPTAAGVLYGAACAEELTSDMSAGIADPNLVEVSGVAVDRSGVAWVLNDSGDRPRIYGVRSDGTVQTVEIDGADAIDWEDLSIQHAADASVIWIADTGANIEPRTTVQLYRVPVPEAGVTSVAAERFDVTYPDGSHDVEALMVDPDGTVLLITKSPGTAGVYRVVPDSPEVSAELLGSFSVGDGERTLVTGADLASDGSTVVLRTYGSVYLVPVDPDQPVNEALAERDRHCRGLPPLELQGEAVSFLPDGSGYVTMGEGRNPYLTTATLDPAAG